MRRRSRAVQVLVVLLGSVLHLVLEAEDARADIAVTTTYQAPSQAPSHLAESRVGASRWDAFWSAAQVYEAVQRLAASTVSLQAVAAVHAAYDGYDATTGLIRSIQDKTDHRSVVHTVFPGNGTARLSFTVGSDDDPVNVRVMRPAHPAFHSPQSSYRLETDGHSASATATVYVDLGRLLAGAYVVTFAAKEDQCGTCLGVVHSVVLVVSTRVADTAQCRSLKAKYEGELRDLAALRADMDRYLREAGYYQSVAQRNASVRMRADRAAGPKPSKGASEDGKVYNGRLAVWRGLYWAAHRQAEIDVQIQAGVCPDVMRGITVKSWCAIIGLGKYALEEQQRSIDDVVRQIGAAGCWRAPAAAPGGGPGPGGGKLPPRK